MSDDDTKEKKGDVPPLSAMSPTLDSIPVDLAAIRSRFPSVELGITIGGKYRIEKEIG